VQLTFRKLINAIGWSSFIIWCLLTFVVLFFLIAQQPHVKGISQADLIDYKHVSIWLLGVFIVAIIILWFLKIGQGRQSS
jgi:hypothetical protein